MADLEEVAALLHVHKGLHEHGDQFPHLKKAVMEKLREIEADHAPKKPEAEKEAEAAEAERDVGTEEQTETEIHEEKEAEDGE